ncbi:MAG: hypothetical protein JWO76_2269 [Nocardioides sp.]|nr:hypothetical protein [Nocardioides sp.]
MRRSIAATAVAMGMALSVMSVATSSATDGGKSTPDTSAGQDLAARQAGQALSRAQDILSGKADNGTAKRVEATLALRDLFVSLPSLDTTQRQQAHRALARPTDGASDPNGDGYAVPAVRKCKGSFCMHWVTSTADAPPSKAWVMKNLKTMNQVWHLEVGKLNYRKPVKDRHRGGNKKFDVYLKELGSEGLYGYCAPEYRKPGTKWLASGYCVLDNDFAQAQYGAPPVQSLRVTAAHEFFHAIQFGYDYHEDPWFMEATATWMEERFADGVNDNRQYLPYGQVKQPGSSLDVFNPQGFNQYGNWPFFEFLSSHFGKNTVHQIWNKAGASYGLPNQSSMKAVSSVLRHHGGLKGVFARYAAGNTAPGSSYPEGKSWPSATIAKHWHLTQARKKAGAAFTINHLSSRNALVNPTASLKKKSWMLRVVVNGPSRKAAPAAYIIVKRKHGHSIKRAVHLNKKGHGKAKVPFSSKKVKGVTITLANASTRYNCWERTYYSCQGRPKDQGSKYHLTVVAFKHKR